MTLKNLFFASLLFLFLSHRFVVRAIDLDAYPEYLRPGPDGKPVSADRSAGEPHGNLYIRPKTIQLRAARNGYVSFFLVVKESGETPYSLSFRLGRNLQAFNRSCSRPGITGFAKCSSFQMR